MKLRPFKSWVTFVVSLTNVLLQIVFLNVFPHFNSWIFVFAIWAYNCYQLPVILVRYYRRKRIDYEKIDRLERELGLVEQPKYIPNLPAKELMDLMVDNWRDWNHTKGYRRSGPPIDPTVEFEPIEFEPKPTESKLERSGSILLVYKTGNPKPTGYYDQFGCYHSLEGGKE